MKNYSSGIYMIQSFSKPERTYIGSAVNIQQRWWVHLCNLRKNKHHSSKLQHHYNKYGEKDLNFIILICCGKEDLIKNEQYFLDSHKTYFNTNIIASSALGIKRSPEFIQKLRKPKSKEHARKMGDTKKGKDTWNKGIKNCHSDETLSKMQYERTPEWREHRRKLMTGTVMSVESSKKKGEYMLEYWTLVKAGILPKRNYKKRKDMSKSAPTLENPCKKWIDFKADEGKFYYFDKSIGEKGKNIEVPTPIYFSVLDELSLITGFNKRHDSGIISNEVSSVVKEKLRVRTFKGGESVVGFYSDVKDSIIAMGGKFTKSVYALLIKDDSSTEFVNFKFKGAAFSAWLDKGFNPMNFIVGVTEFVEEKNGNNTYQVPVFKPFKSDPNIDAAAVEQDKVLQEYLKVYKAQIPEKEVEVAASVEESPQMKTDPFPASPAWHGGNKSKLPPTKEELVEEAKKAMEAGKKGKQYTPSMTDPQELTKLSRGKQEEPFPQRGEDNSPEFDDSDEIQKLPF
jgi:group I intron endonuclease